MLIVRTILLLFFPTLLAAQPQHVFTRISSREGLVSNYVYSILQDRKGFWWFGTANGLQRYDGRKIIMFKAGVQQEDYLPSQPISQLFEDKTGKFWVRSGTEIGLFDPATFRYRRAKIKAEGNVAPRAEYILWQSGRGEVFVVIRNHGIYGYDSASHSFNSRALSFKLPDHWAPIKMADDGGTGRYWIIADSGLSLFDPVKKQLFNKHRNPAGLPIFNESELNRDVTTFFVDHSRRAWIVTWAAQQAKAKVYCYDLKANSLLPDTAGMTTATRRYNELQAFYEQRNGTIWAFGRMLLLQYDQAKKQFYYIRNEHTDDYGLKYDELLCMYEDRENNVWLGTDQGVYVFNPSAQAFHSLNLLKKSEEEGADRIVTSFLETKGGEFWAATWGIGIVGYTNNLELIGNRLTEKAAEKDDNYNRVWSLCQQAGTGIIWAGCQSGRLIVHNPLSNETRFMTLPIVDQKTIRQVVEDRSGNIWLGTQYGYVVQWKSSSKPFEDGFKLVQNIGTIINRMIVDDNGFIWIGTHQKGVYKLDPSTGEFLAHYTSKGETSKKLFSDFVSDLAQLNDSTLLVASGALNIIHLKNGTIQKISSDEGLPANNINSIAVDDQQGIWLGMLGNLARYNIRKSIFTTFSQKDGVINSNFQPGAALKISGDRMIFGTFRDIVAFNPKDVRPSIAPPDVNITDFKLFNTYLPPDSILALDKVRLKPNENSITIEFAALSFLQKDKIIYYYRLNGIDKDFQRVENSLSANYKLLPAGNYTFQVFCENAEGTASKNVTTLHIFIEPPFWQTWWFILLIVATIAALIYVAHRIRVNRILDMEKVRTRIARDLHDDMGSTLSTINILSEMAKMKVQQDSDKTSEYLNKISDNSTRMMEAMDDIVWSINPMNDNMVKITARMREFATGVLEAKDIDFNFRVDAAVLETKLDMEQRRDFFLLFKEAVNNLAKYSQCRHADIEISIQGSALYMKIADDGIGFDVHNADIGNGLTNMRKRASNIGGNLNIDSRPGEGTIIRFRLHSR